MNKIYAQTNQYYKKLWGPQKNYMEEKKTVELQSREQCYRKVMEDFPEVVIWR